MLGSSFEITMRRSFNIFKRSEKDYNPLDFIPNQYKTINPTIGISQQNVFSDNRDFYKAQLQVLKSIYYLGNISDSCKFMFIPVIVYEGGMYRYDIINEKETIKKINYLRYVSQGIPEAQIPVYIDIVDINYFSNYLDIIEKELEVL